MKRIYHTWEKWECYPAGFYNKKPDDEALTEQMCRQAYADFLKDTPLFEAAMQSVLLEWKKSCEHYLSNETMNRIAWLGQASMCYAKKIPAAFCGGFNLLTEDEQLSANMSALKFLNQWLEKHGESSLTLEQASSKTKANLY